MYVNPDDGKTVEVNEHVEVEAVPAVVAFQLVVVLLLLKSLEDEPLSPISTVILVVL